MASSMLARASWRIICATLGVGPEVVVGLCVERSLEMLVALLGILKAGGAYLPLDPDYPRERLAFMLARCARAAAAHPLRAARSLARTRHPHRAARRGLADHRRAARHRSALAIDPHNAVYVTYTSGSTGTPKGVVVTHRNVVRLVKSANYVDLTPDDVFLQFAPLAFDASTFEIWGALLNGARLVVYPDGPFELPTLKRIVAEAGISVLWLTAALFHQVVDEDVAAIAGVKTLLAGGDVLSPSHVRAGCRRSRTAANSSTAMARPRRRRSVPASLRPVRADFQDSVPIGRPISNTRAYVLDAGCSRCLPASRASSTSRAPGWRAAISGVPG